MNQLISQKKAREILTIMTSSCSLKIERPK